MPGSKTWPPSADSETPDYFIGVFHPTSIADEFSSPWSNKITLVKVGISDFHLRSSVALFAADPSFVVGPFPKISPARLAATAATTRIAAVHMYISLSGAYTLSIFKCGFACNIMIEIATIVTIISPCASLHNNLIPAAAPGNTNMKRIENHTLHQSVAPMVANTNVIKTKYTNPTLYALLLNGK
jgi:hypothetical protein